MLAAIDRLTIASGRELLRFLEGLRGPDGVIRRSAFEPEDLRPWLGAIAIARWDDAVGDYVYRLFGTDLAQNIGRDLTGLTMAEWSPSVAPIMRTQADVARSRGTAIVSHYRMRIFRRHGVLENGVRTQEKLVVPLAYGEEGGPDAVLTFVDQRFSDVPIMREHMDATDGSCWCAADEPVCGGCPLAAAG